MLRSSLTNVSDVTLTIGDLKMLSYRNNDMEVGLRERWGRRRRVILIYIIPINVIIDLSSIQTEKTVTKNSTDFMIKVL